MFNSSNKPAVTDPNSISINIISKGTEITGNINLEMIIQTEESFKDATGEDLSDMLDLGFVI